MRAFGIGLDPLPERRDGGRVVPGRLTGPAAAEEEWLPQVFRKFVDAYVFVGRGGLGVDEL